MNHPTARHDTGEPRSPEDEMTQNPYRVDNPEPAPADGERAAGADPASHRSGGTGESTRPGDSGWTRDSGWTGGWPASGSEQHSSPPPAWPPAPPGAQPPPAAPGRRPHDRQWPTVVGAAVLAAVLASGATAAAVVALQDDAGTTTTTTSSASAASADPAPLDQTPTTTGGGVDWGTVADAVSPSVVTIQVRSGQTGGEGTGVILDSDGHVLTNNHVASPGANGEIRIVLSDGRIYTGTIVGLDPTTDLAVLQITDPPGDLQPASLGSSSDLAVGEQVMAIGNPLGLSDTVTTGIISALDRPVTTAGADATAAGQSEPVVTNAIQTDAAINPGNSGGPLVDTQGRVIGINSSIASNSQGGGQAGSIGLGFAIPVDEASRIADELVSTGEATHAWLGVNLQDSVVSADGDQRLGADIADVVSGTPAEQAGLRSGDVVTALDGESVTGAESLTAQIRERAPGSEVTLDVARNGSIQQVQVTLGNRSQQ